MPTKLLNRRGSRCARERPHHVSARDRRERESGGSVRAIYKLTAIGYQWMGIDGEIPFNYDARGFAYCESADTAKEIAELYMPDARLEWKLADSWWIADANRPFAFPMEFYVHIKTWVIIPFALDTPLLWTAWMPGGSMYKAVAA
jgi:hypothetical protein